MLVLASGFQETFAQRPVDLNPGLGIRQDFLLDWDVETSILRVQSIYHRFIPRNYQWNPDGSGSIDTQMGVRLYFGADRRVHQIVVYDPNLIAPFGLHVYSRRLDVIRVYGNPPNVSRIMGGYYLSYQGIGFDCDERTGLVRAIVIFP